MSTLESRAAWRAVAAAWERHRDYVWSASRPISERLVELLAPAEGDTVLELAAGPGDTGFLAARRIGPAGRLVSSDFVPEMVGAARRRAAELGLENVTFEILDAQSLVLADESVDGVLCRWGYMLVEEPPLAFAETRRVLRPGGNVALAVWGTPEENPWASSIGRVLVARGLAEKPEPDAPGPFRLADPERVQSLLEVADLEVLAQEDVAIMWRYESFDAYWEVQRDLARSLVVALEGADQQQEAEIQDDILDLLEPYRNGDELAIPGLTRVTLARRPG